MECPKCKSQLVEDVTLTMWSNNQIPEKHKDSTYYHCTDSECDYVWSVDLPQREFKVGDIAWSAQDGFNVAIKAIKEKLQDIYEEELHSDNCNGDRYCDCWKYRLKKLGLVK
jgi:hypothetical protein